EDMEKLDADGDGYIDDFDLFFVAFDVDDSKTVTVGELMSGNVSEIRAKQLVELIDTFHPDYEETNEGVIDFADRYAKIRGTASFRATVDDWEDGAAEGNYHDDFSGPIDPRRGDDATRFGVADMGFLEDE